MIFCRYLEAFKIYENKPPEVLQGIKDTSYQGHLNGFLTSIRGVNKTDVARSVCFEFLVIFSLSISKLFKYICIPFNDVISAG